MEREGEREGEKRKGGKKWSLKRSVEERGTINSLSREGRKVVERGNVIMMGVERDLRRSIMLLLNVTYYIYIYKHFCCDFLTIS